MYACICLYVYVCVYVCVYVWVYVCFMHVCVYIYMCVCIYVYILFQQKYEIMLGEYLSLLDSVLFFSGLNEVYINALLYSGQAYGKTKLCR